MDSQFLSSLLLTFPRPGYNTTVGVPTKVITNHFQVKQLPTAIVQQWAVDFITDKKPPATKSALMRRNNDLWSREEVQSEFAGKIVIYNGETFVCIHRSNVLITQVVA